MFGHLHRYLSPVVCRLSLVMQTQPVAYTLAPAFPRFAFFVFINVGSFSLPPVIPRRALSYTTCVFLRGNTYSFRSLTKKKRSKKGRNKSKRERTWNTKDNIIGSLYMEPHAFREHVEPVQICGSLYITLSSSFR